VGSEENRYRGGGAANAARVVGNLRRRDAPSPGHLRSGADAERPLVPMDHDDPPDGGLPSPDDRLWRHPSELAASGRPASSGATDPDGASTPRTPRSHRPTIVLLAVIVGLTGAAAATLVAPSAGDRDETRLLPVTSTVPTSTAATVVDAVGHAVVRVSVEHDGRVRRGSGVVVRPDGLVVTSALLVDGVDEVTVTWASGRREAATVSGADDLTGLAALSVDDAGLSSATVAASPARPGEVAYTVASWAGAPDPSISRAHVSAAVGHLDEAQGRLLGLITTSSPVPRWADGGALVDAAGGWQGISLAVPDDPSSGWAVPATVAVRVADDLRRLGYVDRGWLGVWGATLPSADQPDGDPATVGATPQDGEGGVLVLEVSPGSPAAAVDLRVGDVVVTIDGEAIRSFGDLRSALTLTRPGDEATVEIRRDGERHPLVVTLAAAPR